jgi:hypothetical protein
MAELTAGQIAERFAKYPPDAVVTFDLPYELRQHLPENRQRVCVNLGRAKLEDDFEHDPKLEIELEVYFKDY